MKANFQGRLIAYCFDYLFALGVSFAIVKLFGLTVPFAAYLLYFFTPTRFYTFIFYFIYMAFCLIVCKGVSLGGLICNVKVVREDGTNLTVGVGLIRALLQTMFPLAVFNVPYMLIYRTQISIFDACSNSKTIKLRNVE